MAVSGHAAPHTPIFQPSRAFSHDLADEITELTESIPMVSTPDGYPNQSDAAIARVLSPDMVQLDHPGNGCSQRHQACRQKE